MFLRRLDKTYLIKLTPIEITQSWTKFHPIWKINEYYWNIPDII